MRIAMVHYNTGYGIGGAESVVKNLSLALGKLGHQVDIYTTREFGKNRIRIGKNVNVYEMPYLPIPFSNHLNHLSKIFTPSIFSSLFLLIKKYDIVHCHFYLDGFLPILISKLKNTKTVFSLHGFLEEEAKVAKLANKIITLTSVTKKYYERLGLKNLIIVPDGVDTKWFRRDKKVRSKIRKQLGTGKKFAVLTVARPSDIKDPELLADVIKNSDDNIVFILIGISEAEPLKSLRKSNVRKLGIISDSEKYYSAADLFLLTSKREGFGIVLLEAMAAGLPILTTVAPHDLKNKIKSIGSRNPLDIVKKIEWFRGHTRTVKIKGRENENYVKRFDWGAIVKKFEKLYESLLRN